MLRVAQSALWGQGRAAVGVRMSVLLLVLVQGLAQAQTAPPAKTDANTGDIKPSILENYQPSEEMKRRAMGPLRIIRQMGERKAAAPAPAPSPAPAPAPAPAVVAKPKAEDTAVKSGRPMVETPPEPPPVAVAAPAPAPVIAQQAPPKPAPAPAPVVVKAPNLELIPIRQDPPAYTRAMARNRAEGVVKVAFDINMDGSTSDIQVASSTNRILNTSALEAVAKWRFKPIDEDVRVEIELAFNSD